jgi:hypothetical protein
VHDQVVTLRNRQQAISNRQLIWYHLNQYVTRLYWLVFTLRNMQQATGNRQLNSWSQIKWQLLIRLIVPGIIDHMI